MPESAKIDWASEADELASSSSAMQPVIDAAEKAKAIQDNIDGLEEALKAQKKALREIVEDKLPEMMRTLSISNFELEDGTKIKLEEKYFGSLPKDEKKRNEALEALRRYGGEQLIKNTLSIDFNPREDNFAKSVKAEIEEKCPNHVVTLEESVHPQTLASFAREKLRNGEEMDTEKLGLFVLNRAKFTAKRR